MTAEGRAPLRCRVLPVLAAQRGNSCRHKSALEPAHKRGPERSTSGAGSNCSFLLKAWRTEKRPSVCAEAFSTQAQHKSTSRYLFLFFFYSVMAREHGVSAESCTEQARDPPPTSSSTSSQSPQDDCGLVPVSITSTTSPSSRLLGSPVALYR